MGRKVDMRSAAAWQGPGGCGDVARHHSWTSLAKGPERNDRVGEDVRLELAELGLGQAESLSSKLKPGDAIDMFVARIPPDRLHGIPLGRDSIFFSLSVYSSAHQKIGSWSRTVEEPALFSPQYADSECIVETPSNGAFPLPKFDTVAFQGCSAIDSGNPLTRLHLTHNRDVRDSVDNYTRNVNGENQFLMHWLASK